MYVSNEPIIKAIQKMDSDSFFKESLEYLKKIDIKKELDDFVHILLNLNAPASMYNQIIDSLMSSQKEELAILLREKIITIMLKNSDLPEFFYLRLFRFYRELDLDSNEVLKKYVELFEKALISSKDYEFLYLNNMLFLTRFLDGNKKALHEFIKGLLSIALDYVHHIGLFDQIVEFFKYCEIEFDDYKSVALEFLKKDSYRSSSPLQRRIFFNWSLHGVWNIPRFYNSSRWNELYEVWKERFYEHLELEEIPEAMYLHFYIFHKMGNSFQTQDEWERFNNEICIPASIKYSTWAKKNSLIEPKKEPSKDKKLIGFLWDRIVENSPFKVAYSLWKALLENDEFKESCKIKLYLASYIEKSENDPLLIKEIKELGIEIFDGGAPFYKDGYYNNHLYKAIYLREQIIKDGVDILIHGHGYDIVDFIVATRAAPIQIYWNHGNDMYNIQNIDRRITHCGVKKPTFEFDNFVIPIDADRFYTPPIEEEIVKNERAKYPKDVFILGSIGRLVKIDNYDYLETVAKILKDNPNTIYIACGVGNFESIIEKLKKLKVLDRFYFPGWVNPHVYGYIIDLYLDTFPLGSGESLYEYFHKNRAPVLLADENHLKLVTSKETIKLIEEIETIIEKKDSSYKLHKEYLKKYVPYSHLSYICDSKDEYVKRANALIKDASFRAAVGSFLVNYMKVKREQDKKSLFEFFKKNCNFK